MSLPCEANLNIGAAEVICNEDGKMSLSKSIEEKKLVACALCKHGN